MIKEILEVAENMISRMEDEKEKGKRYIRNDYEGIVEKKRLDFVTTEGVPVFAVRAEGEDDVSFKVSFKEKISEPDDYWFVCAQDCDDLIEYFTKMKNILIMENQEKQNGGKISS